MSMPLWAAAGMFNVQRLAPRRFVLAGLGCAGVAVSIAAGAGRGPLCHPCAEKSGTRGSSSPGPWYQRVQARLMVRFCGRGACEAGCCASRR